METLEGNKWRGGEDKMEMEEEGRGAIISALSTGCVRKKAERTAGRENPDPIHPDRPIRVALLWA